MIQMTRKERFTWKDVYQWQTPAFLEVMNGLDRKNQQLKEENEELKKRIDRQAVRLKELYDLILNRDYNGQEELIKELEELEELLQKEMGWCCVND